VAQQFATKYQKPALERFKLGSLTDAAFSSQWEWTGAKSIVVSSVSVPSMNDYDPQAASNRFGTPTEVDTTAQTLTLTQDKGREQIVDFGNLANNNNIQKAGAHLRRVIDEVVTPDIDGYRLGVLGTSAAATDGDDVNADEATDKDKVYTHFLGLSAYLSNNKVPLKGRYAWLKPSVYNFLKAGGYLLASEAGMGKRETGVISEVDGVKIIVAPDSYFPANTAMIMTHKRAQVGPVKLKNYRVLDGQQGYDGQVLQWRFLYDAFVLDELNKAVAVHKTA
jgi:hypothetical protein